MKRFLSMLLVLVMALSMLPMSALAAKIDVNGTEVNLDFGGSVNPNTALDADYDIKAVGGIQMKADPFGSDKLKAEGYVELYVPFSAFEEVIWSKAADLNAEARNKYNTEVATQENAPRGPFTEVISREVNPVVGVTVTANASVSFQGTAAEIIDTILNQTVTHDVVLSADYSGNQYQETVTVNYRTELGEDAVKDILGQIVEAAVAAPGTSVSAVKRYNLAKEAWVNGALAAYDAASDKAAAAEDIAHHLIALAAGQWIGDNVAKAPDFSIYATPTAAEFRTVESIEGDTGYLGTLIDGIINAALGLLEDDFDPENVWGAGFYGELGFAWGETLADRIDVLNDYITNLASDYGMSVGFELPTGTVGQLENQLRTIIANINSADEDDVVINGAVKGYYENADDQLETFENTGIYVVAGVNSADTDDMIYVPYVLAPEVVDVKIQKNGDDAGYFIRSTYGESLTVGSTTAGDADNLMQLRICGVETDGTIYDSEATPTEAGVYTVFSLYFDEDTMAMGGDAAVLVIEPAEVNDFGFAESNYEFDYEAGKQQFPTTSGSYAEIQVATKGNEVYVKLPANLVSVPGAAVNKVENGYEAVVDTLDEYSLVLPGRVTALVTDILAKLETAAGKAGDTAVVDRAEVKDLLIEYLTELEEEFSKDAIVSAATEAVDKIEEKIQTNETIKKYKDMIKSVLDNFNLVPQTYAMRATPSTEDKIVSEFIDKFLSEVQTNRDDIETLMTYLVDWVEGSSYTQDAETLIKTLGAIGGMSPAEIKAYVDVVTAASEDLKAEVSAKVNEIKGRTDKIPTKADAAEVLADVETFIDVVVAQAKAVVQEYGVGTVYFNILPSAAGVYDCYAVNVAANYMPKLISTTMEIKAPVVPEQFDIYRVNLLAGDGLDMFFYVKKADLDGTDYYAVVTKTFADGRGNVVRTIPYDEWEDYNSDLVRFGFDDISAKEMKDTIYVTVYNGDGTEASNLWEDSVYAYAVRAMAAYPDDTELLTALTDMLNYGAAAQNFFSYNTGDLANEGIDQSNATVSVSVDNYQVKDANLIGSTVSARNKLVLTFYFKNITTDMTAYVTYTDHYNNEETLVISGDEFISQYGGLGVDVTGLAIADGRQLVTCVIRDGDQEVARAVDSVESFAARSSAQSSDVVFENLMKFVDSAYAYFH